MHADDEPSETDETSLELRLLGSFEVVHRPSGELIAIPAAKMRALIVYLAAAPRHTETRRTLAGLLWADKDEKLARQSLRQLLSHFKAGADPRVRDLIASDETTVGLDRSCIDIDRTTLLHPPSDTDIPALARAADLYRGDFAAGSDIGEPEFDDWLQAERLRCRDSAIRLMERLIRALADAARHEEALFYANRLVEMDPVREQTHRLVIAEEAAVSGRASAMARYEQFRLFLRDELGVHPEAATLRLLEDLRQSSAAPDMAIEPAGAAPVLDGGSPRGRTWRHSALAAGLIVSVLLGSLLGFTAVSRGALHAGPAASGDKTVERILVAFPPFGPGETSPAPREHPDTYAAYEAAARDFLVRNLHLSVISSPASPVLIDEFRAARDLHARYLVRTEAQNLNDQLTVTAILYDPKTGERIFAQSDTVAGDPGRFAQRTYEPISQAILLHHAHELALQDPNSTATLIWQAVVEQSRTGSRAADPADVAKFNAVLTQDPQNIDALVGLAGGLIERAARDLSKGLNRTDDLYRAEWHLDQAKQIAPREAQPIVLGRIAFLEGLLAKLQGKLTEAKAHYQEAIAYTPGDAMAAADLAQIDMFLGHLQEAFAEMEAIPNFDYPNSSFQAAETALMSGHTERALFYYDRAVSNTPEIPRIYAWRAIALWRLHRPAEAHQDALKSQEMKPAYRPYWIRARADFADVSYRTARDQCAADFEAALTFQPSG
jgi:DNA-binding SARP family transcriptional activator/Flp pilus assembly protein TadD